MSNGVRPTSTATAEANAPEKPTLKSRALDELRRYLVATLYLWLLFSMFSLYRRMILQEEGISVWEQSFAIVNALVFAKVMLIAQVLNLGAGLRKYPLIYSVLGSSLIFTIVLVAFHVVEEAIRAVVKGLPLATSIADFGGGTVRGFLTLGAIMFVALVPFFAVQEVGRVVGGAPLWDLFFSSRVKTFRLVEE